VYEWLGNFCSKTGLEWEKKDLFTIFYFATSDNKLDYQQPGDHRHHYTT
jgi:hypothetical protein